MNHSTKLGPHLHDVIGILSPKSISQKKLSGMYYPILAIIEGDNIETHGIPTA